MDLNKSKVLADLQTNESFKDGEFHQAIVDLGYDKWQTEKDWSYNDMLEFVKLTYGDTARMLILISKYHQQVCNGGHSQYYYNGYAGENRNKERCVFADPDPLIPLHLEMIDLFKESELGQLELGKKVLHVMNAFCSAVEGHNEPDFYDEDEEDEMEVEFDSIDDLYFTVSGEWKKTINSWIDQLLQNQAVKKPQLKESTRDEIESYLFDGLRDSMFGDGLEEEYILDGINFTGLNHMSDEQLLDELALFLGVDDAPFLGMDDEESDDLLLKDPYYELYQRARKELKRE